MPVRGERPVELIRVLGCEPATGFLVECLVVVYPDATRTEQLGGYSCKPFTKNKLLNFLAFLPQIDDLDEGFLVSGPL